MMFGVHIKSLFYVVIDPTPLNKNQCDQQININFNIYIYHINIFKAMKNRCISVSSCFSIFGEDEANVDSVSMLRLLTQPTTE